MAGWKTLPDLKYAKTDEWLKLDGSAATIGLSDYAQDALNDIVFVELPKVGATVTAGEAFGTVESVKAASDLVSPVSGTVTAVNTDLESSPEQINSDPYGSWIVQIAVTDGSGADDLLDAAAYDAWCASR
jgi:glycine cleavage system H protein